MSKGKHILGMLLPHAKLQRIATQYVVEFRHACVYAWKLRGVGQAPMLC